MSIFSERLAILISESNVAQKELAKAINMDATRLSRLKTSEYNPTPDEIRELCRFFQVSADYLVGLSDAPHPAVPETKAEHNLLENYHLLSPQHQLYVLESTQILVNTEKDRP